MPRKKSAPPKIINLRPPVVTVMGHVDHGKTSLLDAIRKTTVAAKEFGGITQHIGAYEVETKGGKKITFIDTPGHAAFSQMRARGGQAADLVVLVVAANDGVMPQTKEAIAHAQAAKVPIVVAINKIDLPEANPTKVKQQLAEAGVYVEGWGGDTVCVEVSAKTGQGLENLLEMILLSAEMLELKSDPTLPAQGLVIESGMHPHRGPLATVIIRDGTLNVGQEIVVGKISGKVRALINHLGKNVDSAGPSVPVEILGLPEVPEVGSLLYLKGTPQAQEMSQKLAAEAVAKVASLADLAQAPASGVRTLNVILKGDVAGSLEAIAGALGNLEQKEVLLQILHKATGDVSESDVLLASSSRAVILAFNIKTPTSVAFMAEQRGVEIRTYNIIYQLLEDIEKAMQGVLIAQELEIKGRGEVLATFKLPSGDLIVGVKVLNGRIKVGDNIEIRREGMEEPLHKAEIKNIKHGKEEIDRATKEMECGLLLKPLYLEVKKGDVVEVL